MNNDTRIIGIDPGLRTTGFGIIESNGSNLHYIGSGVITTQRPIQLPIPERLKILHQGIAEICSKFQPGIAAVEIVFVNANPQSTLLLGQARGACITGLVVSQLPVAEYTALQMKQAISGYGRASKQQIQEMVKRLLCLPSFPGADAADALGIAITHAHAMRVQYALGASSYKSGRSF